MRWEKRLGALNGDRSWLPRDLAMRVLLPSSAERLLRLYCRWWREIMSELRTVVNGDLKPYRLRPSAVSISLSSQIMLCAAMQVATARSCQCNPFPSSFLFLTQKMQVWWSASMQNAREKRSDCAHRVRHRRSCLLSAVGLLASEPARKCVRRRQRKAEPQGGRLRGTSRLEDPGLTLAL